MAFKMSPIGKRKCPYSPLQKRGLINPSPVMNNGDEKKVSSSSSSYQQGKKLTEEQLKAKQAELQRLANKTGESQSWSNMYSTGGKFDEVWKKMSEAEKAKHGNDFEKWKKKAKEYNEKMRQSLTADPQTQNKTKSEIQSKAQPNTESMGSRVKEGQYDKGLRTEAQYKEVEISPGVYVYKKVEGTGGKVIPQERQYTEVERTKPGERRDDLDQNTVISSTGDDKDVKNYLEEQQAEAQQGLENIRNEEVNIVNSGGG